MNLLVTKAHPSLAALHARHPEVGRLVVPKDCARIAETAELGIPWAADNSAFSRFDEPRFLRMLDVIVGVDGCRFVVAPDVVADAGATLELFGEWGPRIRALELPAALALQDGLTLEGVPWDEVDAVFIGGSSEWKMGLDALAIVSEAKRRGLWVHMGRVNTLQRIRYANAIGCDSVDGSQWSLWTDTWVPRGAAWVGAPRQTMLEIGGS